MEKYKINSILLPVDFSELSRGAVITAAAICKRQHAELTMIYIVDDMSLSDFHESGVSKADQLKVITEQAYQKLDTEAKAISEKYQIEVKHIVEKGNSAVVICEIASKSKFSMIVIGAHGQFGFREYLGKTAYYVVKNAPCPVLVIRDNRIHKSFKKIIYPIRSDQKVFEKYNYISPIIEQNNSELIIAGLANKDKPEHIKEVVFYIDLLRNQCMEEKILYSTIILPCNIVLEENNFAIKTIETARNVDADLIVISSHIEYDLKENKVASFAQYILIHSTCSILSISPFLK
jgi:nucleotide-binding universal stress UspA family protein